MVSYSEFEEKVKKITFEFEQWQHLLPAIPHNMRMRYLDTLNAGWDMPRAFDIVLTNAGTTDDVFAKLLATRLPGNNAG